VTAETEKRMPGDTEPSVKAATITTLTPKDFQRRLVEHGFDLPEYGADGDWGDETASACDNWFAEGTDLLTDPSVPITPPDGEVGEGLVPADWMPDCDMDKIIIHWTAGSYTVSATDREHYHIIVGGDGHLAKGDKSIKANVSTSDNDGYAAHTKNCNSKSIGVSAACMAGAWESPFNAGAYPLKQIQWDTLAEVAAELCNKYNIAVTPTTVLQHGEVEDNLNIAQDGKWDICKLPWAPSLNQKQVGDQFRDMVKARM
jgi:hypothetical protein